MQESLFKRIQDTSNQDKAYDTAYQLLNPGQKEAVDRIEGPVMVIAGPGTGKTQVLAVRIGKILRETDANPHNILCLTFTESASIAMRNRLVSIIGPAAHQVHIFTFHSFCNQVIQENSSVFGGYRELQVVSELEKVEILTEILDELSDDHALKRLKGIHRFDLKRLDNLFSLMKKENLRAEKIESLIEQYLETRRADASDSELYYQINRKPNKKGDLKQAKWDALVQKMNETHTAVNLFDRYQEKLHIRGRYDYHDMLLWVLEAFNSNVNLLADYQERYHYFLVDEFQDTNGAQKEVLEHLISYWPDNPNFFVVGDDDQAIYKFQGANLSNITEIYERYNPVTIVLEDNYRSTQPILDGARTLIGENIDRLVNHSDNSLTKDLVAANPSRKLLTNPPELIAYPNTVQESAALTDRLTEAHRSGRSLSETAVIYRKHAQVDDLLGVLDKRNVPYNVKRQIDIFTLPLIDCVLHILTYLRNEARQLGSGEELLFKIMHFHFFGLPTSEIARIAIKCGGTDPQNRSLMRTALGDAAFLKEIGVRDVRPFITLYDRINKWIADTVNETLQGLLQNILNEGEILAYVLSSPQKTSLLQVLTTFFDFIKDESSKDPELNLDRLLEMIEKMKDNRIALGLNRVVYTKNGAHFITAHSAKGLEFDEVILLGATDSVWDKGRRSNQHFKLPDAINQDSVVGVEDERRLFFVAMTRARTKLRITYSTADAKGKPLSQSRFVDEVRSLPTVESKEDSVGEEILNRYQFDLLSRPVKDVRLIDTDLINSFLEGFRMSVTALNKFLKCPLSFYFETVLRVPTARTKYMGFGKAVHDALHDFFVDLNGQQTGTEDKLVRYFHKGMGAYRSHFTQKEFDDMTTYGERVLAAYHNRYLTNPGSGLPYHLEVNMDHAEYKGVPIKGFLDKVEGPTTEMIVTDYKTGNPGSQHTAVKLRRPNKTNEHGGDYWRQVVFYKILADSDKKYPWQIARGSIDFVEPDRQTGAFKRIVYDISREDERLVGDQIVSSWEAIQNHEFDRGCDDEKCRWCNFVKSDFVYLEKEEDSDL